MILLYCIVVKLLFRDGRKAVPFLMPGGMDAKELPVLRTDTR